MHGKVTLIFVYIFIYILGLEWRGPVGALLVHGERFSGLLVPLLRGQLDAGTRSGFEAMNDALKQALLKTEVMH